MSNRGNPWRLIVAFLLLTAIGSAAHAADAPRFYRLVEGLTVLVNNPDGKEFTVNLDVRDINLLNAGPREVLYKVYDPDGVPVVREIIPDDGVASTNFLDRIGGWDHELQYFGNLYEKGTVPSFRWSAWSDPARLNSIVTRSFNRVIKGGKKGVYRVVLAGCADHYVTLGFSPDLKYAVSGNPTFIHGHGDMLKKAYVYVPKGTVGIFFAACEPDMPRDRRFKLSAPDGKVLFDGVATGGYVSIVDKDSWSQATIAFEKPGQYDGQLLTVEVSPGKNDFLLKVTLQQTKVGVFADYVGMGSMAVFADDAETANAIKAGTVVVDDQVFWHPFQVRFHNWLKANKLDADDKQKELRKELQALNDGFRLLDTSDGRGSQSWSNWAYAMGYYGFRVFRPGMLLMPRGDVPAEVKAIIKEGLIMAGDRLSYATALERVNGNAFSQINVALWYCMKATGDKMQQERFEVFFDRWQHGGWGAGAGLSKSGDSQEHFAHDMHYGSYLMDNWKDPNEQKVESKNTWVPTGILADAKDEPRFKKIVDRYRNLYSYLYCREVGGAPVDANPWSSRTMAHPHHEASNWEIGDVKWKGDPGPDLTVSVNDGNEWFAARRKNYYMLTFHGDLAPEWMSRCFPGQLGFGAGAICQLTVPGKGPVLTSILNGPYGEGMHPSQWRNFHIHSLVGEKWDGEPMISGIGVHDDAKLVGNTVSSSGEVRNAGVRVARSYTYNPDSIDCEVALSESDYARVLSIWSHDRQWSEVKFVYEMIPFYAPKAGKPVTVTFDGAAAPLAGGKAVTAKTIKIDCGGYGVEVHLERALPVKLGENSTVLVLIAGKDGDAEVAPVNPPAKAPTVGGHPMIGVPANQAKMKYKLMPFGN
jgi:hypothetical protein